MPRTLAQRIRAQFQAERNRIHQDWGDTLSAVYLRLAQQYKMPVQEIKRLIKEGKKTP